MNQYDYFVHQWKWLIYRHLWTEWSLLLSVEQIIEENDGANQIELLLIDIALEKIHHGFSFK